MADVVARPRSWSRPDAVWLVGAVLATSYLLPARTVVPGLGDAGRPGLLLGFGCLMLWFLLRLTPGMFVRGPNPLRVLVGLLVCSYLVSYAVGYAHGLSPDSALGSDRSLLRYAAMVGVLLVALDGLRTRERLLALLRVLILLAGVMAAIGLIQFLFHYDLTAHMTPPGLTVHGDLIRIGEDRGAGYRRVAATSGHYIEFGVLMAALTPLALHFGLYGENRARRHVAMLATAMLAFACLASVSRSAILALTVAALAMVPAWTLRTAFNLSVLGLGFILGVSVLQPGLLGTFRSMFRSIDSDPSIAGRTNDYDIAGRLISERPWFGQGVGSFPAETLLLDNQWLGFLITNGLVGALALAGLILGAMLLGWSIGRRSADPAMRHLGFALAAPIAAITASFLTFDAFWFHATALTLFTLLGCVGALWRLERPPGPSKWWAAILAYRPGATSARSTTAPERPTRS